MKKRFAAVLAGLNLFASWTSRGLEGNGVETTEPRSVSDFDAIEAEGAADIVWSRSQSPALSITGDQNILPHLRTEVGGKTLRIYSDQSLAPKAKLHITLGSSDLIKAKLGGAIHLSAAQLSGSRFEIDTVGAAKLVLSGTVETLHAKLEGASRLDARELNARDAIIVIVGAAAARVSVTGKLDATVTGAGSLTYAGNPASMQKNVTGAGQVRPE